MKGFLSVANLLLVLVTLFSCSHFHGDRYIASYHEDLSGTYLGLAKYKLGRKGPNHPAIRLYLREIESEPGSYNAVLLEYVNLAKMAPQFISSTATPRLNEVIGYLKYITEKVSVFKVVPTSEQGVFEMQSLVVQGDEIVPARSPKNSKLILSKERKGEHPLVGATISTGTNGIAAPISFPATNDESDHSLQFTIANLIYNKIGLKSTWRMDYLTGDYLAAYAKKDDKVLDLYKKGDVMYADFFMKKYNNRQAQKRRERIFTNKKSAYIHGRYKVIEPRDGMFVFKPQKAAGNLINPRFVEGRIGVLIDIFDNSARGQDVVELIMVNTRKPTDFLMYYEHPDNGEGR